MASLALFEAVIEIEDFALTRRRYFGRCGR